MTYKWTSIDLRSVPLTMLLSNCIPALWSMDFTRPHFTFSQHYYKQVLKILRDFIIAISTATFRFENKHLQKMTLVLFLRMSLRLITRRARAISCRELRFACCGT